MPYDARNDFNGDGRSDVLLQNLDDGGVTDWLGQPDGSFATNFANAYHHGQYPWLAVGAGDFNGDGKDDILWTGLSGSDHLVGDWLGQASGGFSSNFGNFLGQVGPDWTVKGVGDFNGDGLADVLWQGGSVITDWLGQPNGGFRSNFENATCDAGERWFVLETGDFNGDGRDDILWGKNSGEVTDWLGQVTGGFVSNYNNWHAAVDLDSMYSWHTVGAGDFNGDGRDDILWRRDFDGLVTDWLGQADGSFISNFANATHHVGPGWFVAGIGDYNGDQRDDILWQTGNEVTNWLAQPDGGFASNDFAAHIGGGWHITPHLW